MSLIIVTGVASSLFFTGLSRCGGGKVNPAVLDSYTLARTNRKMASNILLRLGYESIEDEPSGPTLDQVNYEYYVANHILFNSIASHLGLKQLPLPRANRKGNLGEQSTQILLDNQRICTGIADELHLLKPSTNLYCDEFKRQSRILTTNSIILRNAISVLFTTH